MTVTTAAEVHVSPERHLERLITRMLFDPTLVEEVYHHPERLLQSGDLTQEGLRWIQAVDPRRWRADHTRSHRALEGLLLHLPLTLALTTLGGVNPQRYLAFFGSAQLHQAITDRRLLSAAFSEWLSQETSCPWPQVRQTINALELSVAELKSEEAPLPASMPIQVATQLTLSPYVRLNKASPGTLERSAELTARLNAAGPHAALTPEALTPCTPLLDALEEGASSQPATMLTQRVDTQVSVSELPPALAELLWSAHTGASLEDTWALLGAYELDLKEAQGLLVELTSEGLLLLS